MNEREAYERYDDYLNTLYPLGGLSSNPFSVLLRKGDPIAYYTGFGEFCEAEEIEVEYDGR